MIDVAMSYETSRPCTTGAGAYFSSLWTIERSGEIREPVHVKLGRTVPDFADPISLAQQIFANAIQQQPKNPRLPLERQRPVLMTIGRGCLRILHEDRTRNDGSLRAELLGSIIINGDWKESWGNDIVRKTTKFDALGIGRIGVNAGELGKRTLEPAVLVPTVRQWVGPPQFEIDEWPIANVIETRFTGTVSPRWYIATRGVEQERQISYSDAWPAGAPGGTAW